MKPGYKLESKVLAAFATAILIVLILATTTWKASHNGTEAALSLMHTQELLRSLAEAKAGTLLIELRTQNYIISGDAARLADRDAAISARETWLRRINELTADHARQQERWTELRELLNERLAIATRLALLRKAEGFKAATAYATSAPLQETQERMLQIFHKIEQEEHQMLARRSAEPRDARQIAVFAGLLTVLMLIAVLAATYSEIRQQMRMNAANRRALEESREATQSILNTIVDGVITINERGLIENLNPATERLFGYAAAEIIGQNVKILMPEPYHSQHDGYLDHYRATGEARIIGTGREVFGRRKDGRLFPLDLAVGLLQLGNERRFTGIVRDITARKQSENQLNSFFELSLDLMCIPSADGYFKRVNTAFTRVLGWTVEEMQARPFLDFVHPDDQAATRGAASQVATGEKLISFENRYLHKDGSWRDLSWNVLPQENGLMFATARDVTDSKGAEQAIIAAKNAAEQANRAKDSFLAIMSHEIRTPLGGMLGMLELLSLSPLDNEQGDTLQAARDSGYALLQILNDVLDWSKIEDEKLELSPQPTSIARVMTAVTNTYSYIASVHKVTLAQQVDPRLSPVLMIDSQKLSQVLNNFVSNAIKFSPGGCVDVRAELIDRREGAEQVRFSVSDTGIGIAPEIQKHLFQPYRQADADTTRLYGGTGLGLAICRRLADLMDGHIDMASNPGRGSTFSFTLTLPVADAPVTKNLTMPASEIAAMRRAQSAGGTTEPASAPPVMDMVSQAAAPLILVVDDISMNRKLLARQLGVLGLRAETVEDGKAALRLWRDGNFALVITDCHMPVMDGYELTRAIRSIETDEARERTPIFAWTAAALDHEIANYHAAGMDEFLIKPVRLPQLKQLLTKWLPTAAKPIADPDLRAPLEPQAAGPLAVDVSVLKALVGDDAAVIREFLHDFRTSLGTTAAELRDACQRGQAPAAGATAHKLKSTAHSVGALKLGDLCGEIEHAGKTGDIKALDILLPSFESELVAVNGCLDSLLQEPHQTAKR